MCNGAFWEPVVFFWMLKWSRTKSMHKIFRVFCSFVFPTLSIFNTSVFKCGQKYLSVKYFWNVLFLFWNFNLEHFKSKTMNVNFFPFFLLQMQSAEFKYNKHLFLEKAKKWTQEHAVQKNAVSHWFLDMAAKTIQSLMVLTALLDFHTWTNQAK